MNFLITGGAGFLGSALSNRLARQGHNVRVIDDLSAGDPARLIADVHFTRGDVNDRPTLWTLLQDVDCVFHLAAKVSVPESVLFPRDYNRTNVSGTVSLLEAARDAHIKRMVFISSGAVYGTQARPGITEEAVPQPDSPYAVSKLSAEYYVRTIGSLSNFETVCLRVFNAYGPGQRITASHPPIIANFIKQAMNNGTLIIHGDGNQTRDYVYVDDVVNAMVSAATASEVDQKVINVGSGVETSVRELVNRVVALTKTKPEEVYNPTLSGGISRISANISLANKLLGYTPLIPLDMGLRLTMEKDPQYKR